MDRVFAGAVVAHGGQASRDVVWRVSLRWITVRASSSHSRSSEGSWRSGRPQMVRTMTERVEHDVAVLQGRAMPELERLFREHHERVRRRLPPLYEC